MRLIVLAVAAFIALTSPSFALKQNALVGYTIVELEAMAAQSSFQFKWEKLSETEERLLGETTGPKPFEGDTYVFYHEDLAVVVIVAKDDDRDDSGPGSGKKILYSSTPQPKDELLKVLKRESA